MTHPDATTAAGSRLLNVRGCDRKHQWSDPPRVPEQKFGLTTGGYPVHVLNRGILLDFKLPPREALAPADPAAQRQNATRTVSPPLRCGSRVVPAFSSAVQLAAIT